MNDSPLFCRRCGAELPPGRAEFYVVKIEAFADPTVTITEEDLQRDIRADIARLVETMSGLSEQEAMDQVYRKLTIYLCNACYREWIEHPTG
ncbi:MAG TPA: hypothetical protein PKY77_25380 [Phycisphaerae bacterium]|nr:hypothetical protein [Phycisphaerae bacterium]HRY71207.1 hypothetical protein [Phycisphaerae bacterium]HSA29590.1 hypothetical protein [Phycisphaerae bacterium]